MVGDDLEISRHGNITDFRLKTDRRVSVCRWRVKIGCTSGRRGEDPDAKPVRVRESNVGVRKGCKRKNYGRA